jgi:nitrate/nitrite-specific signal transduction histidine kinase
MFDSLFGRLLAVFLVFLALLMGIFGTMVVSSQASDGLVVNLAGRQRMLSQKMTKEALIL